MTTGTPPSPACTAACRRRCHRHHHPPPTIFPCEVHVSCPLSTGGELTSVPPGLRAGGRPSARWRACPLYCDGCPSLRMLYPSSFTDAQGGELSGGPPTSSGRMLEQSEVWGSESCLAEWSASGCVPCLLFWLQSVSHGTVSHCLQGPISLLLVHCTGCARICVAGHRGGGVGETCGRAQATAGVVHAQWSEVVKEGGAEGVTSRHRASDDLPGLPDGRPQGVPIMEWVEAFKAGAAETPELMGVVKDTIKADASSRSLRVRVPWTGAPSSCAPWWPGTCARHRWRAVPLEVPQPTPSPNTTRSSPPPPGHTPTPPPPHTNALME